MKGAEQMTERNPNSQTESRMKAEPGCNSTGPTPPSEHWQRVIMDLQTKLGTETEAVALLREMAEEHYRNFTTSAVLCMSGAKAGHLCQRVRAFLAKTERVG